MIIRFTVYGQPHGSIFKIIPLDGTEHDLGFQHQVFEVTLAGKAYVVDLAGAQYGQHQAVVSSEQYWPAVVHGREEHPLGHTLTHHANAFWHRRSN